MTTQWCHGDGMVTLTRGHGDRTGDVKERIRLEGVGELHLETLGCR